MSETIKQLLGQIGPVKDTAHNKVTIVGVGQVGMAIAHSILQQVFSLEIFTSFQTF
jgi:NADH/NAD ratio-sensing transcriptional regulator Rex